MTSSNVVASFRGLPGATPQPWEQAVIEVGLGVLALGGTQALSSLIDALHSGDRPQATVVNALVEGLSLREASGVVALLETSEADRRQRNEELLRKALKMAAILAEELLKAALMGPE